MGDEVPGLGELRAEMRALLRAFEAHRDEARQWQRDILDRLTARLDAHSKRIGNLERWRAWILGAVAAIGTMLMAASGALKTIWSGIVKGGS